MSPFLAEIIGTALLLILGDGVVANVILNKTKGNNSGWIVIALGWGLAVFVGVFSVSTYSGAHINPAVTLALALTGGIGWDQVPVYMGAQLIGASIGAIVVWICYKNHFDATPDPATKLGVFCTGSEIRNPFFNFLTEMIGTFVLVLGVLFIAKPDMKLGAIDALPVALLVTGIGLSLGGPTGYAINPARDLGPRLMHAILPIKNKGGSDWTYAWIPILGPLVGGTLAAFFYRLVL